jgi:hypothetical protein
MKFHTSLTETEVRACLERAKSDGDMPADVEFDVFGTAGSRTHPRAYEIHLATSQRDTRADGKTRSSSPLAGGNGLRYAATYDEWGYFLAEFFAADPAAKAGPYKSKADFHARTQYAYAMGMDELPAGTRPADPEPEPEYASTEPTTSAHTCTRHCGPAYHPDPLTVQLIEQNEQASGTTLAGPAGYRTPNHP